MKAYRDQYAAFQAMNATILGISTDKEQRQAEFKASLSVPFPMLSDPGGRLALLYGVKFPLLPAAKRVTFVIGTDQRILRIDRGRDALDPQNALKGCT